MEVGKPKTEAEACEEASQNNQVFYVFAGLESVNIAAVKLLYCLGIFALSVQYFNFLLCIKLKLGVIVLFVVPASDSLQTSFRFYKLFFRVLKSRRLWKEKYLDEEVHCHEKVENLKVDDVFIDHLKVKRAKNSGNTLVPLT